MCKRERDGVITGGERKVGVMMIIGRENQWEARVYIFFSVERSRR